MQREKDSSVTLFIDIDGTIFAHRGNATQAFLGKPDILPGVLQKFNDWSGKGYHIILTTARRESMRKATEKQLRGVGLFWDQLIMGIGSGQRIVINDTKIRDNERIFTALGINLIRDEGFTSIEKLYTQAMNDLGIEGEHEI